MSEDEDVINLCCNCGCPIDKKGNCMYDEDGQIEEVFELRKELSAALEREAFLMGALEVLQYSFEEEWGEGDTGPAELIRETLSSVKAMREGK